MDTMKRLDEEIALLEKTCGRLHKSVGDGPGSLGIGYEGFTRLVAHYHEAAAALEMMRQRLLEEKRAREEYEGGLNHESIPS